MKWIVDVKGRHDRGGEISVIAADNRHGVVSYGWFDERKILIAGNGGPCDYKWSKTVWKRLIAVAHEVAAELNEYPSAPSPAPRCTTE